MRTQTLVINFIDSSVEFVQNDLNNFRDYIGSVRIPLGGLFDGVSYVEGEHPVKNHLNKQMGSAYVRLTFAPYDSTRAMMLSNAGAMN